MAAFTKIVIDTNVIIRVIDRELKRGAKEVKDACRYALEVLSRIFDRLLKSLQELGGARYIHFMPGQVDELKRWLNANVCMPRSGVEREIEHLLANARRRTVSSGFGFRFSERSEIETLRRRLKSFARSESKRLEEQISSLHDEVDRSIACFTLGRGARGEKVKVVTGDGKLCSVLLTKATELGLRGYVEAVHISTINLDAVEAAVRDP